MSRIIRILLVAITLSIVITYLSKDIVSFGFMGGQIYLGFPIRFRMGYSVNMAHALGAWLINLPFYIITIFFIESVLQMLGKRIITNKTNKKA